MTRKWIVASSVFALANAGLVFLGAFCGSPRWVVVFNAFVCGWCLMSVLASLCTGGWSKQ